MPPTGRAWLRARQASAHDRGFHLRGRGPLSQDLACWDSAWWVKLRCREFDPLMPHRARGRHTDDVATPDGPPVPLLEG